MINVYASAERGRGTRDWLESRHTFSFAEYHDPDRMGFGPLRVINEDWIAAAKGFDTHPHRDMEIITYMLDGQIRHQDSMGNGSVIRPGELQRMTAGTGVLHSEFNASESETAHLLQIWILPESKGLQPGYEQTMFAAEDKQDQWRLIGSRDGREGSLTIHQDVSVYDASLTEGKSIDITLQASRRAFLHVVAGSIAIDDKELVGGDAVTIEDLASVQVRALQDSDLLLFDMK